MTYDPELIDRLVREAREDEARMTDAPWIGGADAVFIDNTPIIESCTEMDHEANCRGIARTRNNLTAMADQLEAARHVIDILRRQDERQSKKIAELDGQLEVVRREVERLVDVIRDARSQVLDWSNTTMFTLARANLAVTLDDAIDNYRAAKGKT